MAISLPTIWRRALGVMVSRSLPSNCSVSATMRPCPSSRPIIAIMVTGFTGAGFADNADDLALVDGEVQAFHRAERVGRIAELDRQVLDF